MRIARLRALTLCPKYFTIVRHLYVEMRIARLRALTQNLSASIVYGLFRRNEDCPTEGIDTLNNIFIIFSFVK